MVTRALKWSLLGAGLAILLFGLGMKHARLAGAGWAVMGLGNFAGTIAALRRGIRERRLGPIREVERPKAFRDAVGFLLLGSCAWVVSGVLAALGLVRPP